jgi:hypothetical protein
VSHPADNTECSAPSSFRQAEEPVPATAAERCAADSRRSGLSAVHCSTEPHAAEYCEEQLFATILAMAADRETPLQTLYADAVRLAYPARADEEVRLAVLRYERYLSNPPQGMDKFGNPLWIRLPPSSTGAERKRGNEPEDTLFRPVDSEDEEEAPTLDPSKRHFLGKFFSQSEKNGDERLEESRTRRSYGDIGRSRAPVRLIRAAVFVTLFAVLYYCLTAVF